MKKISLVCSVLMTVTACDSDSNFSIPENPSVPDVIKINSSFNDGDNGWKAGFSDYPPGSEDGYMFKAEITNLPNEETNKGFLIASHNSSDDVFMYLKRPVDNLKGGIRYSISGELTFYSNAPLGCFGVGGSPGDAVYIKVGASEIEPEQVDYYMNVDIGFQANSGNDAKVIGNAGAEGVKCGEDGNQTYGSKTIKFGDENPFRFTASDEGSAWLFVGSDSGYEGYTELYFTDINLTLTPVND